MNNDLSKTQVSRAGETVRLYMKEERPFDADLERALDVISRYRAAHQYALTKASQGLRSMVRTEGCDGPKVSQRLKRFRTILDKLQRQPGMQLARMQDIGGCRAVLASIEEVRSVEKRLAKNRPPIRYSDYIANPKGSGYRGVHVVVSYPDHDGAPRAIEVQLRTAVMHEWAVTVERLSGRIDEDLKSGRGPHALLVLFRAISEAMATEETGGVVSPEHVKEIERLRASAVPYLSRRRET